MRTLGLSRKKTFATRRGKSRRPIESNAVVIAMMDVSGSMGEFKKYIARSFYFWMVRFLKTKYDNVKIVFISHHTEAKEVTEEQFFTQGESGGTVVSSAYRLALDIIGGAFPGEGLEHLSVSFFGRRQLLLGQRRSCKARR